MPLKSFYRYSLPDTSGAPLNLYQHRIPARLNVKYIVVCKCGLKPPAMYYLGAVLSDQW